MTGLCIIAKRVDTGAPWVLSNNPHMPYFNDSSAHIGNKHYKLESLIRASTAAPFLFTPTEIVINTDDQGNPEKGLFVDGGMSPHNNPSLQLLLMAGLPSYKLNWKLSEEDLLLISVGTGQFRTRIYDRSPVFRGWKASLARSFGRSVAEDINEAAFAAQAMTGLIGDSGMLALTMMQSVSRPRFSWHINSEIGNLTGQMLLAACPGAQGGRALLKFQRYDLPLEMGLVEPKYDIDAPKELRMSLYAMDDVSKMDTLYKLATAAALKQVSTVDFNAFL
jgi:hypothetical protein